MTRDIDSLSETLSSVRGSTSGLARELAEAAAAMRGMDREAQALSRSLGTSLGRAFDKAVFGGKALGDVLRGLGRDVAGKALDAALRPIQGAIGSGISSAVGALAGGIGTSVGSLLGFSRGGAFAGGRALSGSVKAFARGGVVSGPTLFPMRGGAGLMGEAGPEAILPLERGADGRLGVSARGGGGGQVVNVTIQTPDVESFRRSRGQVAAELARAVGRGNARL